MPSRFLCDVLDDMRKMYETRNFSGLMGAIEDAQRMASRMEAALGDRRTIEDYDTEASTLNRQLKNARKELNQIGMELKGAREKKERIEKELKRLRHDLNKESKGGTVNIPLRVDKEYTPIVEDCPHCGMANHTGPCGPHDIG